MHFWLDLCLQGCLCLSFSTQNTAPTAPLTPGGEGQEEHAELVLPASFLPYQGQGWPEVPEVEPVRPTLRPGGRGGAVTSCLQHTATGSGLGGPLFSDTMAVDWTRKQRPREGREVLGTGRSQWRAGPGGIRRGGCLPAQASPLPEHRGHRGQTLSAPCGYRPPLPCPDQGEPRV